MLGSSSVSVSLRHPRCPDLLLGRARAQSQAKQLFSAVISTSDGDASAREREQSRSQEVSSEFAALIGPSDALCSGVPRHLRGTGAALNAFLVVLTFLATKHEIETVVINTCYRSD